MIRKIWDVKLTRFGTVGIFNTLLDLAILNILVLLLGAPIVLANLVSATISMTISYFLNHHFVFRSRDKHSIKKFLHFFTVTGVGILGIQSLVIYLVTHFLKHHPEQVQATINTLHLNITAQAFELNLAKILAVLIAMIWNFTIYHFVIFKKSEDELDDEILL